MLQHRPKPREVPTQLLIVGFSAKTGPLKSVARRGLGAFFRSKFSDYFRVLEFLKPKEKKLLRRKLIGKIICAKRL